MQLEVLIAVAIVVIWIVGLAWLLYRRTGRQSCRRDIQRAKEFGRGRDCTAVTATMTCPDADVAYLARNGCQIDYLLDQGWEIAD